MTLGTAILLAAVISTVGGLIVAFILRSALKQKKSCSCGRCWHHEDDGLCYHKNPITGSDRRCMSYRSYGGTEGDNYDE